MLKTIARNALLASLTLGFFPVLAQSPESNPAFHYQVEQHLVDLDPQTDLLPITLTLHGWEGDVAEYHMPRIIPGTYDIHDYGRFVHHFTALDTEGDTLPVTRLDSNRWKIDQAQDLKTIRYQVGDTYDAQRDVGIFEPAGTSHEDSVFLLNNFGYIGYLQGYEEHEYHLQIHKPRGMYGATALEGTRTDTLDEYRIEDYFTLHDNPLLYAEPDTAWHQVGNTEVLVAVFSPNGLVSADLAMEKIAKVLDATGKYLGGKLPADKYAVLLYTSPVSMTGGGYGALEHHTSTVLHMPEIGMPRFYDQVKDITAHEFFHIITPLRIHSQYVSDFDFIDPEMSRHIWLYEGVTEYNSHIAQVRDGIYTAPEFLRKMKKKLERSDQYDPEIPLTQASRHTLTFFKDEYLNFYQKGALAAMALDLKLIDLSGGDYRLVHLLQDMGQKFGTDTFFYDDHLFEELAQLSDEPDEVHEFLVRHMATAEALPLPELLRKVGVKYVKDTLIDRITMGGLELGLNQDEEQILVTSVENLDQFGRDLGWQEGDILRKINGEEVTVENIRDLLKQYYEEVEPGDKVKIRVEREDEDGDLDREKLKARARIISVPRQHVLELQDDISPQQKQLRKAWLNI